MDIERQKELGFINGSGLEFDDISSEQNRLYHFANGAELFIAEPLALHVSKSGGHRVIAKHSVCYYVQPKEGWYITWTVKQGEPNVVR